MSAATKTALALDHINFDWLDANAQFLKPLNRSFDIGAFAVKFQTHDPDFIRHASLADIGHHLELLPSFQISGSLINLGGYISHRRVCCGES